LESQNPHHRRRLTGAAAVAAAALTAAGLTGASMASASTTATPELQTLTYTATGPGGALYRPIGVSALNGTVYASDTGANVLASIANGTTTAVAGSLSAYGEHGDGGKAVNATLYHPGGTAEDAKGDVFIADSGDNVVREVTAAGVINRFAGTGTAGLGKGASAANSALDHPQNVAVDAQGDVFIADTYNNRVVKVTPQGKVSTVAGDGVAGYAGDGARATSAKLSDPTGLALDAKGNLYIADSANNVIRRVDVKSGIITTVAGDFAADKASDGLGGFSGDAGPATSARLNDPQGVALDGAGDLFIADTFNNAVREVTPAGVISTVVNAAPAAGGSPAAGAETSGGAPTASKLNTPYGVGVDQSTDDLYVADTTNSKIAEVTGLAQSGSAAGPTASASTGTTASPTAPAPTGTTAPAPTGTTASPTAPAPTGTTASPTAPAPTGTTASPTASAQS
jgi:sugar lactone lactonase YvrE